MAIRDCSEVSAGLASKLRGERRLFPLQAPAYSAVDGRSTVIGLHVDLEAAWAQAMDRKARSLEVFADVVEIPDGFIHFVGPDIRLVSVVARAVDVRGDRNVFQLVYDKESGFQPTVRFLADDVEGACFVSVVGQTGREPLRPAPTDEALRYTSYTCDDEGLVKKQGRLASGLLDVAGPLHQLLSASFDLAAGAMRAHVPSPEQLEFARAMLRWMVRWAAYPSPYLGRLFQDAETLSRLLPVGSGLSGTIYSLPPRTPDAYLRVAKSQLETAEKYELDKSFQGVHDDLRDVVSQVVGAWIGRDAADLTNVEEEISRARLTIDASQAAMKRVAKELEAQQFDATIKGIDYRTEAEKDKFLKIMKMTFEVVTAVIEVGVAISGVVGNPGAVGAVGNLAKLDPFHVINIAVKAGPGRDSFLDKAWAAIQLLYALPYATFSSLKDDWGSMSDEDKKGLSANASTLGSAASRLMGVASTLVKINDPLKVADQIGDLVSKTAAVANPVESRAVWDSFETETGAEFEKVTRDPEASRAVVNAILAYRTVVKKYAIYQRAYSEQQALLAQQVRDLGTLMLRKVAIQQKTAALEQLRADLTDKDQTVELLGRLREARLYELRQAFFTALCRYRSAFFYENLSWPSLMPAVVVPTDAAQMREAMADIARALADAKIVTLGDFSKDKVLDTTTHPDFFTDLASAKEAKVTIDPSDALFANQTLVRLDRVRAWLIGPEPTAISVELVTAAELQDRPSADQSYSFSGQPFSILFEYSGDTVNYDTKLRGVRPTPFTTWTVRVSPGNLDLGKVEAIRISMVGESAVRSTN